MIKVRDVPTEELKIILEKKCQLPATRAALMVKVMENLQIYRSAASIFSGKDSTITVRDLLKWAGRINANSHLGSHVDQASIALEGFLVLAERSRDSKDKAYI
jgi:midasin